MTSQTAARGMPPIRAAASLAVLLMLAACGPGRDNLTGDANDHRPFSGIAPADPVHATGNEPAWSVEIAGRALTYKTPADQAGQTMTVSRFAGRGGVSFGGTLADKDLLVVVTPGQCSDGMSQRTYPFVATLQLGDDPEQHGCAWTDAHPFKGPRAP